MGDQIQIQVLLPVHNEADSIERTVREIYGELSKELHIQFIICEDGSRDGTKEILRRLSLEMPMKLVLSDERKGYSRAVRDGMRLSDAGYLLCLDSDGQCDPRDFWQFWKIRAEYEVVIGNRTKRADPLLRVLLSRIFQLVYRLFFPVPITDPSCPFILIRRKVVQELAPDLGAMEQGFWWEYVARIYRHGFTITELPVQHRERAAGVTQVYKLRKMPGIGIKHFLALFSIWSQTKEKRAMSRSTS